MAFIKNIEINNLRGIQELSISDFSNINIVVGDNNSGKTTFLEAIQLLFAKTNISSINRIIRQRTTLNGNRSYYTSFIKMFNVRQDANNLEVDIYADTDNGPLEFQLQGSESLITEDEAIQMSPDLRARVRYLRGRTSDNPSMVKLFNGSIAVHIGEVIEERDVSITSLDRRIIGPLEKKEINYISSFGHLRYDLLQNIVENLEYKRIVIEVLRRFDEEIEDVCYTKADDGGFMETVVTADGVLMPFSIYGDGIKKILYIMNRMIEASDSILLIDEIETGLHKKYYNELFPVIFALAAKFNVQLFITTHSIEVIDAILNYGEYDNNPKDVDPIRVITLKKNSNTNTHESRVVARNVLGSYVYENRKAFEFEVRL
ncbi:MAG: DUF2813 domain-containing protein [Lachnospiraceae bacterium]|nr:DUF2813 domain-containing protein [Lachnospiraceae bacterium]